MLKFVRNHWNEAGKIVNAYRGHHGHQREYTNGPYAYHCYPKEYTGGDGDITVMIPILIAAMPVYWVYTVLCDFRDWFLGKIRV